MLVPDLSRTGAEMAQEIAIDTKVNPLTTNILASWEQRQSSDSQNLVSQRGAENFK